MKAVVNHQPEIVELVKMLAKTLDTQKTEAAGLMKMMDAAAMERSVNPAIGGNIDLSV